MKYVFIIAILVGWSLLDSYSQEVEKDSINVKQVTKQNWAISYNIGGLYNTFNNTSREFLNNRLLFTNNLKFCYKNFYLLESSYNSYLQPKKHISIKNTEYTPDANFKATSLDILLGYSYFLNNNWGIDINGGIHSNTITLDNDLEYYKEYNTTFNSQSLSGYRLGLRINRYIHTQLYNYIVIGFSADYVINNYGEISDDLGNSCLNYSLTIGFKYWARNIN